MRTDGPAFPPCSVRFCGGIFRRSVVAGGLWALGVLGGVFGPGGAVGAAESAVAGVPLTRFYPLEEIGCSSRGLQLLHDSFGRVAVAQQGEFFVLNDASWQRAWRENVPGLVFRRVVADSDGEIYYGAFGSWGVFRTQENGVLRPVSLVPDDAPKWVGSCNFTRILCVDSGVYFSALDGVVFRRRADGAYSYFRLPGVSCVFPLGGRIMVSTFDDGLFQLAVDSGALERADLGIDGVPAIGGAAGDGRDALLLATANRRLLVLQDGRIVPVQRGQAGYFPGPVTDVVELPEGGFAAAIAGYGVVTIDRAGAILRTFDGADYRDVGALESREPGVLWAATDRGVLKILHGQPFTTFGRDQGLPVDWPQVAMWRGGPVIGSGGRIYEAVPERGERSGSFRLLPGQPYNGGWGLASLGDSLLIGNGDGVFVVDPDGSVHRLLTGVHVARLVALDDRTCLVLGTDAITVLRRGDAGWAECAPRVPGIGYPYLVHAAHSGAWLELGLNRVARVGFDGGRLEVRVIERFAWNEPSWVNVSVLGSRVLLCGSGEVPMILDDRTLAPVEAPELQTLFARSPYYIQRLARDAEGNVWVSHDRGLFLARERDGAYEADFASYAGLNEATPLVQCPAGGGVWASTGSSLFRLVAPSSDGPVARSRPVLVGLLDARTGASIPLSRARLPELGRFDYARNSLQLDFFAGSHALPRPVSYEYRLDDGAWVRASAGSSVFLTDLREGTYALAVRMVDDLGPVGGVSTYGLAVAPPWYRHWSAYASYPLAAFLLLYSAFRFSAHRHRVRMADLERQVDERTGELRAAMGRLREETEVNATLAERNRLAAEIHDSLEQGFAGLALQLETTAGLAERPADMGRGLGAALGMVAYCRNELRHAVQGLHSPALQSGDLESALRRVVAQLAPEPGFAAVEVEGEPRRIDPATEHHLLRIAQEALANVVKHAGARRVRVLLVFGPRGIRLSISDDGRGFDPAAVVVAGGRHLGLPSFRNRAAKIGGTVEILSSPGQGTTIVVAVPGPEPEKT